LVLANADLRGEFLSEARKLQKIDDHPNVVRVVQAGEDDGYGRPYFVMNTAATNRLHSGSKIGKARGPMRSGRETRIPDRRRGSSIHQESLCHRDLKPGNILLVRVGEGADVDQPDFRPKVADLGLASVLDDPDVTTSLLQGPVGTPPTWPRSSAGDSARRSVSERRVMASGAILYEVVSGRRRLLVALTQRDLRITQERSPLASTQRRLPQGVARHEDVVETAMRKEPRYRYGSAAEMADDLKRLADGRPVYGARGPGGHSTS